MYYPDVYRKRDNATLMATSLFTHIVHSEEKNAHV